MKTKVPNQHIRLNPHGASRIAIIGEAPGVTEEQQGIPFCGASGALLNAALSQVGIVRDQCFVGNVCQARPHGNDFNTLDWNSEEVQSGIAQLREDLLKFKPSLILCLGNAALHLLKHGNTAPRKTRQKRKDTFFDPDDLGGESPASLPEHGAQREAATADAELPAHETLRPISSSGADGEQPEREEGKAQPVAASGSFLWPSRIGSWRGSLFESGWIRYLWTCPKCGYRWTGCDLPEGNPPCPNDQTQLTPHGVKTIATYHPAAVLRDFSLQPLFRFDIKRAAQEAKTRELELPKREIEILSPDRCDINYVRGALIELKFRTKQLSFDLEGFCGNVTCLSFGTLAEHAIVIPLAHANGESVWNEDEEVAIWQEVKFLLECPDQEKIMQNGLYDAFVLAWTYGIVIRNFAFDTMVGFWECFAELPKGLATQASILTEEPFYKPDKGEEGEMKFASDEEFWRYNGLDACVTLECHEAQMKLMGEGQRAHYLFNMQLMPALLYMEIRGMKWASEEASLARQEALKKAFELQARIDEEACRVYSQGNLHLELFDLCSLQSVATRATKGIADADEHELARIVSSQLCQKNIKRPVEIVEHRWQPMRWNSKTLTWVKDGKLTKEMTGQAFKTPAMFWHEGETADGCNDRVAWLKRCHKTKIENQPFTPLTLAECEEFVLESCREEWARVKEIWKELKDEKGTQTSEIHSESSGGDVSQPGVFSPFKQSLLGELSTLLSLSINVGSTQEDGDAQCFLYEICGFKEQFKKAKGKKTDKVSSDQNALVKLYSGTQDVRVLWVLQLRRLRKLAADLACEVDNDGRIRSTFSLVKETGRMAASASPTGTGTNLQALNKDLRYLCKAEEGCQFRQRDLKGADSWTVAAECAALGDSTMLDDLRAGMRPAEILALIVRQGITVNSLPRADLQAAIDADKPSWPYWLYPGTKAGMHLTCYMGKVPTLIQTLLRNSLSDLPLDLGTAQPIVLTFAQGEAIQKAVHTRYPGIAKWHKKSADILVKDGVLKTSAGHIRRFYGRKREFKNGQWIANYDTLKEFLASLAQYNTTLGAKLALHQIWYDPENNTDSTLRYRPCFVVHDSILAECAEADSAWAEAKEQRWFGNEIEIAGITVVIPSSREVWRHWGMKD